MCTWVYTYYYLILCTPARQSTSCAPPTSGECSHGKLGPDRQGAAPVEWQPYIRYIVTRNPGAAASLARITVGPAARGALTEQAQGFAAVSPPPKKKKKGGARDATVPPIVHRPRACCAASLPDGYLPSITQLAGYYLCVGNSVLAYTGSSRSTQTFYFVPGARGLHQTRYTHLLRPCEAKRPANLARRRRPHRRLLWEKTPPGPGYRRPSIGPAPRAKNHVPAQTQLGAQTKSPLRVTAPPASRTATLRFLRGRAVLLRPRPRPRPDCSVSVSVVSYVSVPAHVSLSASVSASAPRARPHWPTSLADLTPPHIARSARRP